MMQLHNVPFLTKLAKRTAQPLSRIVCSKLFYKPVRALDAYLNFLLGKGSGTGWDIQHEIEGALSRIYTDAPIVFDLGAHRGEWSTRFLQMLPRARVYLFEPSEGCRQEIRHLNLKYEALIPSAVGARVGQAKFHFSSPVDPCATLHPRGDSIFRGVKYTTIDVAVVTIDSVIQEHKLEFIDFMKMDIEGNELGALQGAIEAFKARRIGALSFETSSGNINSHTFFRDYWTLLSSHGFAISRVTPGGRLLPVEEYYEDCEYFRGDSNYIAELKAHPKRRLFTESKG